MYLNPVYERLLQLNEMQRARDIAAMQLANRDAYELQNLNEEEGQDDIDEETQELYGGDEEDLQELKRHHHRHYHMNEKFKVSQSNFNQ